MSANTPKRTFSVPLRSGKTVDINIAEPDLRADNLNLTTWTSSFILASQLHRLDVRFDKDGHIPILELGAGTGLVGLTAAVLWQQRTILTDLPVIVPGLITNVHLNAAAIKNASADARCGLLDWKEAEMLELKTGERYHADKKKAHMILAADTIYDEEHPELLSNAILTWLARTPNARAILCYPLRVAYLDQIREIWAMLEEGGLEAESDGQEQADTKDWDDECLCEWVVWKWRSS